MASPKPYSKSPKRPTRIDKSTAQRIAETLLLFAPAPIRSIASTPLGSKIFLTVATGLLTTGMMSIDWENGMPKIQWHRENAQQAKDQITQDLQQQGVQWQQTANGPVVSHNGQQYPVPVQNLPGYQNNQAPGYPPPPQYGNPNGYPTNRFFRMVPQTEIGIRHHSKGNRCHQTCSHQTWFCLPTCKTAPTIRKTHNNYHQGLTPPVADTSTRQGMFVNYLYRSPRLE